MQRIAAKHLPRIFAEMGSKRASVFSTVRTYGFSRPLHSSTLRTLGITSSSEYVGIREIGSDISLTFSGFATPLYLFVILQPFVRNRGGLSHGLEVAGSSIHPNFSWANSRGDASALEGMGQEHAWLFSSSAGLVHRWWREGRTSAQSDGVLLCPCVSILVLCV